MLLFLLSSSSSSLLLSSSSFYYYHYYYHYYHYYYYYYYYYYYCHYSVNNIPYQCDITCAGHFTLDALASRTVACLKRRSILPQHMRYGVPPALVTIIATLGVLWASPCARTTGRLAQGCDYCNYPCPRGPPLESMCSSTRDITM